MEETINSYSQEFCITPFDGAFVAIHKDAIPDINVIDYVGFHTVVYGQIGLTDLQLVTPGSIFPAASRHPVMSKQRHGTTKNTITERFMKQVVILSGVNHIRSSELENRISNISLPDECIQQFACGTEKLKCGKVVDKMTYGMKSCVNTTAFSFSDEFLNDIFQYFVSRIEPENIQDYLIYIVGTPRLFLSYIIQNQLKLKGDLMDSTHLIDIQEDYNIYVSSTVFQSAIDNNILHGDKGVSLVCPLFCGSNSVYFDKVKNEQSLNLMAAKSNNNFKLYKDSFLKYFVCDKNTHKMLTVDNTLASIFVQLINDMYVSPFLLTLKNAGDLTEQDYFIARLGILWESGLKGVGDPLLTPQLSRPIEIQAMAVMSYLINNVISTDFIQTYRSVNVNKGQNMVHNTRLNNINFLHVLSEHRLKEYSAVDVAFSNSMYSLSILLDQGHIWHTDYMRSDLPEKMDKVQDKKRISKNKIRPETSALHGNSDLSFVDTIFYKMSKSTYAFKRDFIQPILYFLGTIIDENIKNDTVKITFCDVCDRPMISNNTCCVHYLSSIAYGFIKNPNRAKYSYMEGEVAGNGLDVNQSTYLPGDTIPVKSSYRYTSSFITKDGVPYGGKYGNMRIRHRGGNVFKRKNKSETTTNKVKDDMTEDEKRASKYNESVSLDELHRVVQGMENIFSDEYYQTNPDASMLINMFASKEIITASKKFDHERYVNDHIIRLYNEPFFIHEDKQQIPEDERSKEEDKTEDTDEPILKKRKMVRPIMLLSNSDIDDNTMKVKRFLHSLIKATVEQKYSKKIDLSKLSTVIQEGVKELENGAFLDKVASQIIVSLAGEILQRYVTDVISYFKKVFKTIAQHLSLTPEQLDIEYPNIELYDWKPQRIYTTIYDFDVDDQFMSRTIRLQTYLYVKHGLDCLRSINSMPGMGEWTDQNSCNVIDNLFTEKRGVALKKETVKIPFVGICVDDKNQLQIVGDDAITEEIVVWNNPIFKHKGNVLEFDWEWYNKTKDNDQDEENIKMESLLENNDVICLEVPEERNYKGGNIVEHAVLSNKRQACFSILRNPCLSINQIDNEYFIDKSSNEKIRLELINCMSYTRKIAPTLWWIIRKDIQILFKTVSRVCPKVLHNINNLCSEMNKVSPSFTILNRQIIPLLESSSNNSILNRLFTHNPNLCGALHAVMVATELYGSTSPLPNVFYNYDVERVLAMRDVAIMMALRLGFSKSKTYTEKTEVMVGPPLTTYKTVVTIGNKKILGNDKIRTRGNSYSTYNVSIKSYSGAKGANEFFTQICMGHVTSNQMQRIGCYLKSEFIAGNEVLAIIYPLNKFPTIHSGTVLSADEILVGKSVDDIIYELESEHLTYKQLIGFYEDNFCYDRDNYEDSLRKCTEYHNDIIDDTCVASVFERKIFLPLWHFDHEESGNDDSYEPINIDSFIQNIF